MSPLWRNPFLVRKVGSVQIHREGPVSATKICLVDHTVHTKRQLGQLGIGFLSSAFAWQDSIRRSCADGQNSNCRPGRRRGELLHANRSEVLEAKQEMTIGDEMWWIRASSRQSIRISKLQTSFRWFVSKNPSCDDQLLWKMSSSKALSLWTKTGYPTVSGTSKRKRSQRSLLRPHEHTLKRSAAVRKSSITCQISRFHPQLRKLKELWNTIWQSLHSTTQLSRGLGSRTGMP